MIFPWYSSSISFIVEKKRSYIAIPFPIPMRFPHLPPHPWRLVSMLGRIWRPSAPLLIPRVAKRQDHHRPRRPRRLRGGLRELQPLVGRRAQRPGWWAEGEGGRFVSTCTKGRAMMKSCESPCFFIMKSHESPWHEISISRNSMNLNFKSTWNHH